MPRGFGSHKPSTSEKFELAFMRKLLFDVAFKK